MKKQIFWLVMWVLGPISVPLLGQNIGLQIGWNSSEMYFEDTEVLSENINSLSGFHVGLLAEFFKPKVISLRTGVQLTKKGYKYKFAEPIIEFTSEEVNLYYLEIPLLLNVNLDIGPEVYIFGSVGPYISFGVEGDHIATYEYLGETKTVESDLIFGEDMNRLDYGITFDAGLRLWMVDLGVGYDLGLANLDPDELIVYNNLVWRTYIRYWF